MRDIRKEYAWALKMAKEVLPEFEVWEDSCDYGNAYSIGVGNGSKGKKQYRMGILLEREVMIPGSGVYQWMPEDEDVDDLKDSPMIWALGPPYKYKLLSLNKEKNPRKSWQTQIYKIRKIMMAKR